MCSFRAGRDQCIRSERQQACYKSAHFSSLKYLVSSLERRREKQRYKGVYYCLGYTMLHFALQKRKERFGKSISPDN